MDPYEWDEAKNQANQSKRGFGFELVREFDWSSAVYRTDDREDYGEPRRLALLLSGRLPSSLLCVAIAFGS